MKPTLKPDKVKVKEEDNEMTELDEQLSNAEKRNRLVELNIVYAEGLKTKALIDEEAFRAEQRVKIGCNDCAEQQLENDRWKAELEEKQEKYDEDVSKLLKAREELKTREQDLRVNTLQYEAKHDKLVELAELYNKLIDAENVDMIPGRGYKGYLDPRTIKRHWDEIAKLLQEVVGSAKEESEEETNEEEP